MILIYLIILFVAYWSQDAFCRNKIHIPLRFEISKGFRLFRWILRITVCSIFLVLLFSSLTIDSKGMEQSSWMFDMVNRGYDFDLRVEKGPSFAFLPLGVLLGSILLSEWVLGNLYLKWIWTLLPAIGFIIVLFSFGMDIFGAWITQWIPSDLFQLFFLALCSYLGLSWSIRIFWNRVYRLPFLRIDFEL